MNFSIAYPFWFILLCILAGAFGAWWLYRNQQSNYSSKGIFALVCGLRFLMLSIALFLLLSPILRYIKRTEERPTIVFLQDNSASQKFAFKKIDSISYKQSINKLLQELQQDYNIKTYSFGGQLNDSLPFNYNEKGTDISNALEVIMSAYESQNLSGIILASDGIYNKGISPLSLQYPFKGSIYTIGVGDTTIQKDALVARLFANKVVYLGDQFVIRADVSAHACRGNNFTITVFNHNSNRIVATQSFNAKDDKASKSIELILDAKSSGIQHFSISISKVEGEINTVNNMQDVYVEVMDSKEKILLLANAPHPDIFAIKEALTKNKNYKVEVATAKDFKGQVNDYNLIVLHNIPSASFNASNIIEQASKLGISLWYIVGAQTAIPLFNKVQNCLQIQAGHYTQNEVQASLNSDFSFFTTNTSQSLKSLPPLASPFGNYTPGPATQTLMKQQIGNVSTNYPLWIMQQNSQAKIGVIAGEGLWRWRLYNYNQQKNYNLTDEYIIKTAQYLAVKQDKRPFRTNLSKTVYEENELIVLDAELYNENKELINTPDITVSLLDEKNAKQTFTMNKESNSYSLNMGNLAAGSYTYQANTSWNGKTHHSSGNFKVVALNIEEVNTTADFGMLNSLAKSYQGEFLYPHEIGTLKGKIKKNSNIKTVLRTNIQSEPLINWKWVFALLASLLAAEWFIRKRSGNY